MDSFELNKIIGAILLTALIVIGLGKFTDLLFHVDKPEQSAYKIEGLETVISSSADQIEKIEQKVDINQLLAMGNIAHGEKVFKKCSACHMVASDGKNMIGPNLWGVVGRKVASIADYKYSKALASYTKEWSFEEMNGFLIKPQAHIKGTKMAFAGLRKEKDRASVILFLNSKSKSPLTTP
jgi:cytochrome c|tara:strand:+ start:304 stop:846 length:543 start_codon:yes stop_codon:yes gene_type:complete